MKIINKNTVWFVVFTLLQFWCLGVAVAVTPTQEQIEQFKRLSPAEQRRLAG